MTPSAPDCGHHDLGGHRVRLVLDVDDRAFGQPAHAAEQQLRVALDQLRPAGDVRVGALGKAIVQGQHVVLGRLDQPEPLQLVQLLGSAFARSFDWVQSLLVSYSSQTSSSKAAAVRRRSPRACGAG